MKHKQFILPFLLLALFSLLLVGASSVRYVGTFHGDGAGLSNIVGSGGSGISSNGGSGINNRLTNTVLVGTSLIAVQGKLGIYSFDGTIENQLFLTNSADEQIDFIDGNDVPVARINSSGFSFNGVGLTNLNASELRSGTLIPDAVTLNYTGSTNAFLNASNGPVTYPFTQWDITATNSFVLSITNAVKHSQMIVVCVTQNGTGGYQVYADSTISSGADLPLGGGNSLSVSTAANSVTYLTFRRNGSKAKWHLVSNMAEY